MIFFDYGNTLVYEKVDPSINSIKGVVEAIEEDVDPKKLFHLLNKKKDYYNKTLHPKNKEYSYVDLFEEIFSKLGITTKLSFEEISKIYFDDYAPGYPMDGAVELLDFLEREELSYGVISNLSWSSDVLRQRLLETLGRNIKNVYTSSDLKVRKPGVEIFEKAIKKSKMVSEKFYYVGDNPLCDIVGGKNAGLIPIYFKPTTENVFLREREDVEIDFPHYEIDKLVEIIEIIKGDDKYVF